MAHPHSEHATAYLLAAIVISFIAASSLSVYPLSQSLSILRPLFMIMVLIFWLLFQPRYVGVFTAFVIGLIADLLMDSHLGQQAFAAVAIALVIRISSIYVKQLNTINAWLVAAVSLIVYQMVLWVLQYITQSIFVAQSALSILMSIISWPLVLLLLRRFTR